MSKGKGKKGKSKGNGKGAQAVQYLKLPVEVLGIVAKYLIDEHWYGTCAALNVTGRAIREESMRTLYETVMIRCTKAFQRVSVSSSSKGSFAQMAHHSEQVTREALHRWSVLRTAEGSAWIRFLIVPSFLIDASNAAGAFYEPSVFPRLKAFIIVSDSPDPAQFAVPTSIGLCEAYDYRSDDLSGISRALVFLDITDNAQVNPKFQYHRAVQIHPSVYPPVSPLPSVKKIISRRQSVVGGCKHFRPSDIGVIGPGDVSDDILGPAFLEALYWAKTGDATDEDVGMVTVWHPRMDALLMCAKAYQKAIKSVPALATIFLRFQALCAPAEAVMAKETNQILAVIRGTYLLSRNQISLQKLGLFRMATSKHDAGPHWVVHAAPKLNMLVTESSGPTFTTVLHRDEWNPAGVSSRLT